MEALTVERIIVTKGRLSVLVRMNPNAPRCVTPGLLQTVLERHPTLPAHACVNDVGSTFAAVMAETSIPHLLEHVIIDAQVRDERTPCGVSLVGTTEWLDERQGLARVEVSFTDDLVALRALRSALSFINEALLR